MDNRNVKRIKREDAERHAEKQAEFERSTEIAHMLILMRKYPDKAKEAIRKMSHHWAELTV